METGSEIFTELKSSQLNTIINDPKQQGRGLFFCQFYTRKWFTQLGKECSYVEIEPNPSPTDKEHPYIMVVTKPYLSAMVSD